jgi:uncharacterized membrane protein
MKTFNYLGIFIFSIVLVSLIEAAFTQENSTLEKIVLVLFGLGLTTGLIYLIYSTIKK